MICCNGRKRCHRWNMSCYSLHGKDNNKYMKDYDKEIFILNSWDVNFYVDGQYQKISL